MGFTPREIDDLSLWEFGACVSGWSKANGGESKPAAPSDEEHDALVAKFAHV
jgi:hypothetical protein